MSDASLPPTANLSQRKQVAMLGGAVLLLCFTLAFVLGGKKPRVAESMETEQAFGTVYDSPIDLDSQATPDNWVDNSVPEASAEQGEGGAVTLVTQHSSSHMEGEGKTGRLPGPAPRPDTVPSTAASGTGSTQTSAAVPEAAHKPKPTDPASETGGSAVAGADTGGGQSGSENPGQAGAPAGGSLAAPSAASPQASPAVRPQTQALSSTASLGPSAPAHPAIPVKVVGERAAAASPRMTSGGEKKGGESRPTFVRPAKRRPGVVAQTRTLVTEKQFSHSSASNDEKDAMADEPVRVRQQEARDYAQRSTKQLHEQKALPPTQRVRLPRRGEATNSSVWHEDDIPASADEQRPFGLVVAEDLPAFTPEGIPLRTDNPAGTSPLQQNGPDKPLWKRPE